MFKKLGISLLAFTILIASLYMGITNSTTASAAPVACSSIAECREGQEEARENIAALLEEAEELNDYISEIQIRIIELRAEISSLETEIMGIETDLSTLSIKISELAEEVEKNLDKLEETEERIEELIEEVSQRMRITQRVNNRNTMLTFLSEAENLMDFMRLARMFTQLATADANRVDELSDLIDIQEELLLELEGQREYLLINRDIFGKRLASHEQEQLRLRALQTNLSDYEAKMQDNLYRLNEERHDEEALLEALERAEEILRNTPAPPVGTNNASNSATPQTPNASGLAHPMPGATVWDEFGSRGGSHRGIDLVVIGNPSAPILAAASGTVITNSWEPGFGFYLIISHMINGQRVDTLYGHLRYAAPVAEGVVVSQGQVVGTKGSTGISSGPHLHFEVHPGGISWGPGRGVCPRLWINF